MEEHSEQPSRSDFTPSKGLNSTGSGQVARAEAERLLEIHGRNELAEKKKSKLRVYLEQLWGPMPGMIWAAIIVELGIQNWLDACLLLAIQFANATIGWYETTKAGDAVAALKASLRPTATAKRDGRWGNLDAALLVPGDLVLLGSGSAVPADCIVNEGQIDVDQAALTGESLPVTMRAGDSVKMGSTVVRGEVEASVEFTGKDTFFGKTATMIQATGGMGNLQKLLWHIMVILLALSFTLCLSSFAFLMGTGIPFKESLEFTVIVLVASIPIAIEIVVTTTLALGSRQLASHGAIVTRLAAIEEMAGMNMLCSDKTGTLTLNKMEVQENCPTFMPGMTRDKVLQMAALAAKWREPPRDALDTMVLGAADLDDCDKYKQTAFVPFDPTTKRTEASIVAPDGKAFKVTKGAPHVVLDLCANKDEIGTAVHVVVEDLAARGIRSLAVAVTDTAGDWRMAGMLTFLDPPRPDTKETIRQAMELGVDVKMITGDHALIAKEMCRMLNMGDSIEGPQDLPTMDADGNVPDDLGKKYGEMIVRADGFAQVYPEHKYLIVEALRQSGFATGMTGDGVNDAPALKRADVGIAVAGATDAARAAADIVLTEPGLGVVVHGIEIARVIFGRMKSFLTYRIAATVQLLFFFVIAVFAFDPKRYYSCPKVGIPDGTPECEKHLEGIPDFFSLPVIMLMLITLLNDGTLISIGYDNVTPSKRPEKWRLRALFVVSCTLGAVACLSSLILLFLALDSNNPNSVFAGMGMEHLPYGKVVAAMYLKISISDFLTLFSARTHDKWFWTSQPNKVLLGGAVFALTLSTILAEVWPDGKTDGIPADGLSNGGKDEALFVYVWLYCLFWWLVQDASKVGVYWLMHRYNVFNINASDLVNMRAAEHPDDAQHPLARMSVGMVESRLLESHAQEAIQRLSAVSPGLQRLSQRLSIARSSLRQGRGADPAQMARQVHQATCEALANLKGEDNPEVRQMLENIRRATANLERVARLGQARSTPAFHDLHNGQDSV